MRSLHLATGIAVLALALLLPDSGLAQTPDLKYFTSFTVTGDYVVAGVDLLPQSQANGFVTGTIQVTGIPANADIIAAYLYWETIWADPAQLDGARFRGQPVSAVMSSAVSLIGPYSPCWSNGGVKLSMMRADVRRLLPPQLDAQGQPTGRRVVNHADLQKYQQQFPDDNWLLTVTLPEAGTGNQLPQSAGASLLLVYRNPEPQPNDPVQPLRSIVVYDGVHLQAPGESTVHTLRGFIQSKVSGAAARFTPIVGSGSPNSTDRVSFKSGSGFSVVGTDTFMRTSGGTSDRAWSNPTFPVTLAAGMPWSPYGEQVQTKVDHVSALPYDCLAWAATVFSTAVQDSDDDGLVDQLEAVSGLRNPADDPFPDLASMGAIVGQRDLFVEVGAMSNDGSTAAAHSHMPSANVLKTVGDALANPPSGFSPIAIHFDVGPSLGVAYRSALGPSGADRYVIAGEEARGGESILEQVYVRFPTTPGTVSWPTGYQMYVHAPVAEDGTELTPEQMAACFDTGTSDDPGTGVNECRRRFDKNRQGLFHYLLYAHARGVPKSELPCADAAGAPVPAGPGGNCAVGPNFDYYLPRSVSGIAELPGRFLMVTLGLWDNQVGTEFMQASTTLHELGHNLGLWHGGGAPSFTTLPTARANTFVQPNCKPNYFSIMSYVYQATGVVDFTGTARVRYASEVVDPLNEAGLSDSSLSPEQLFRAAWYTPLLPGTLGYTLGIAPATRHCNGTPLFLDANGSPTELPMGRIDAPSPIAVIDWNGAVGVYPEGKTSQDVNFDGVESGQAAVLAGFNDWAGLRLNQAGAGRNMAGMSLGLDFGGLDFGGLDFGGLDFGGLDFGGLDFGGLDFGGLDFGGLDFGGLDFGGLDFGGLDFGGLDFGGLDFGGLDFGGLDFGGAELDYATIIEAGGTPPNQMTACVLGGATGNPACAESVPLHRNRLAWQAPNAGTVDSYAVRRVFDPTGSAAGPTASSAIHEVDTTSGGTLTVIDNEELPDGRRFLYFTQGSISGAMGGPSNFAIVRAENSAPVANDDDYTTPVGTSFTGNVLANDADVDSPAASLRAVIVTTPSNGSIAFNLNGSFTYTPNPGFSGTDTLTYVANNGTWRDTAVAMSADSAPATVTIHVADSTPPVVTLSIPAPTGNNGYFKTGPVSIAVSATDVSNVVAFSCTANGAATLVGGLTGIGTPAAAGTFALSADGVYNVVCVAIDGAGNTGAAPGSINAGVVKIDTTPPTVTINAPASEAAYVLNAAVASSYSCTDPRGSGVSSCAGPIPSGSNFTTNAVGPKTFAVTATDNAGNVANVSSMYYVRYNAVIDPLKSSSLGSAIPLTWQLRDANGAAIVRLSTLVRLSTVFNGRKTGATCTVNTSGPPVQHYSPATGATGGSDYRLVSSGYKFNWDTTSVNATGRGCYTVIWQFDDNTGPAPGFAVIKESLRWTRAVEVK
jgi:hypothetical protein